MPSQQPRQATALIGILTLRSCCGVSQSPPRTCVWCPHDSCNQKDAKSSAHLAVPARWRVLPQVTGHRVQ